MQKLLFFSLITFFFNTCKVEKSLNTVAEVDLKQYSGLWYEIARLPNSFEKNLTDVTAQYILNRNGEVTVINQGYKNGDSTKISKAEGRAWVPDSLKPGELKVSFFWPFSAPYHIIELDKNYKYALVGSPSRDYRWILSRTKGLDQNVYIDLIQKAKNEGFNVEKLIRVY